MNSTDLNFDQKKQRILHDLTIPEETDLSPKGSVDEPILPIMEVINAHPNYVTTSSCSGRIAVYCDPIITSNVYEEEGDVTTPKGGGNWLMVTHDKVDMKNIKSNKDSIELLLPNVEIIKNNEVNEDEINEQLKLRFIWYKFEPMVLHVQSRDIPTGKHLLEISLALGFRNSGLVLSNKGRSLVGIRSAAKLDVPIAKVIEEINGKLKAELLVSPSYLTMLLKLGNQRFDLNFDHMERYKIALENKLFIDKNDNQVNWESKEERRIRKRLEGLETQKKKQSEKKQIIDNQSIEQDL